MCSDKESLEDGDLNAGEGIRKVRKAMMDWDVYRLTLYIDAPEAAGLLRGFKDRPHASLCKDQSFYEEFVKSKFRKTFFLTFLRYVDAKKLQDGFRKPLLSRVSASQKSAVEKLVSAVPDVSEGDVLIFRMYGDGETVELSHPSTQKTVSLISEEVWSGTQNIFFDRHTEMESIKHGAVQRLPEILCKVEPKLVSSAPSEPAADDRPASQQVDLKPHGYPESAPIQVSEHTNGYPESAPIQIPEHTNLDVRAVGERRETQESFMSLPELPDDDLHTDAVRHNLTSQAAGAHELLPCAAVKTEPCRGDNGTAVTSGDFDLLVEVVEAEALKNAEYRVGDITRSIVRSVRGSQSESTNARLCSVYCQLKLGTRTKQTDFYRGDREPSTIQFKDERLLFAYSGESELSIEIRDCRQVQKILRGDPLVGETTLRLTPESCAVSAGQFQEEKLPLTQKGEAAGSVLLRYRFQESVRASDLFPGSPTSQ